MCILLNMMHTYLLNIIGDTSQSLPAETLRIRPEKNVKRHVDIMDMVCPLPARSPWQQPRIFVLPLKEVQKRYLNLAKFRSECSALTLEPINLNTQPSTIELLAHIYGFFSLFLFFCRCEMRQYFSQKHMSVSNLN